MFCQKKKKSSACLPYFFASLKLLAVTRALVTSKALRNGHRESQRTLHLQVSLGKLLFEPYDIDGLRPMPLRRRGRPTFRDIACARLASAAAPTSCPGNKSELISRVNVKQGEHGAFATLLCSACDCNCTGLPLKKTGWTGDTEVGIGLEMAVGTSVACDSVEQALTCQSFASGRARARGQHMP